MHGARLEVAINQFYIKKTLSVLVVILFLASCSIDQAVDDMSDSIVVFQPVYGESVSCPLHIEGEARGSWYFEASFPVKLLDEAGNVIAEKVARADGDWMTDDFVPFSLDLYYETSDESGVLVLQKDNPSDLPENDAQLEIPLTLSSCRSDEMTSYVQGLVDQYIRNNISTLSPVEPVLGGEFYVVSIEFKGDDEVSVVYEDGHIQESFIAVYELMAFGDVSVVIE